MEKVLGQAEIDALFAAAAKQQEVATAPAPTRVEAYNFGFAGHISNEQLRAISTVNDLFARNLMHTVGAWLRTDLQVGLVSGEQMLFSEFMERVPARTHITSLRLEPQGAVGLMEVELTLAAPIVDLLLGGMGRPEPPRELTDIENLIMGSVVKMIVKELNVAWQPVGLQFGEDKQETVGQVARMMPAGEKTLCVSFEVKMPDVQGMVNLCLPATVLNTILGKLIAEHARPRRRELDVRNRVRELVGESTVSAMLQFPPVRLRARDLATLVPGSTLRLPMPRHAAAELRVGGLPLGMARPVKVGEHRGARMEAAGAMAGTTRQDGAMRI